MSGEDCLRVMEMVQAIGAAGNTIQCFCLMGEPIAKSRVRVSRDSRNSRIYTPKQTVDAELKIAWEVRQFIKTPLPGNIALAAVFYRSNRHRIDVDNLIKTVLDGITKSGAVWKDDCQVTAVLGVMEYDPVQPRTVIGIAAHVSTMLRGQARNDPCETCGGPTNGRLARKARYCSVACRPKARERVCLDCGAPTSAPQVMRCRPCYEKSREVTARSVYE